MKKIIFATVVAFLCTGVANASDQDLKLNNLGYFETHGVNVLIYSNLFTGGFNDEKDSGIELIHHGVRTATGGAVRLSNTPEQWDLVPTVSNRTIDSLKNTISATLRYEEYDFDSRIVATAKGKSVEISVYLDKPVPKFLEGKAGFNLEFLPSQYWGKTYLMDGRPNLFPRSAVSNTVVRDNSEKVKQFNGYSTSDDRGTGKFIDPLPLETGHTMLLAPDTPERMVKITSQDADLMFFDGRILAQNGWFVVRSLLPAGKTGKVLTWTIEPNDVAGWIRKPNIGFSQVGYIPSQKKVSVIELDKQDKPQAKASVYKVNEDGKTVEVFTGAVVPWGDYYKYHYVKFDFSSIKIPGIYYIQYGDCKTNIFLIGDHIYDDITNATNDIWIPIHMDHMTVNEAYRVWHGEPWKEGPQQAPPNTKHFDMHWQGPTTDTKFKPLETIPGLNIGGWFDAGDYDIETGTHISVVQSLSQTWELFKPLRDETYVDRKTRYVDLHRPDGFPDLLQQIEQGTLQLVAQAEVLGHMAQCISNSVLDNYHHLGDAATLSDGLPYNPELGPYEVAKDGKSSGVKDDRWAFTSRDPGLDLRAVAALLIASRALKGYNDDLSARASREALRLFNESKELYANRPQPQNATMSRGGTGAEIAPNLQLYITTGKKQYADRFEELLWTALDRNVNFSILTALEAIPHMSVSFKEKLRPYVVRYKKYIDQLSSDNPYGVPIGLGNWAGSGQIVNFGITNYLANNYFPDIVDVEAVFKTTNWIFGCHPYHNYSLVSSLGTRPKEVFYGNNRADFSFIPGNLAPGLLFRLPDHFENYDDWPFFWGQNEGTIGGNSGYLLYGSAVRKAVKNLK